ncbi:MarR family winged helix-turn-helix transcriptional regulator [Caldimonas brevitalea]|uniref:Transcriptional regulator, MarR family n=1 Tax=Caldimonas brevitalea TaxID=413882 RepID=A0A0G3BVU2_9BURK|nr:MarR family winged helix-turn-helix transcriptional regulator [Caldimonas brevitalea]AKJ32148.1 transcriptional regulator, MarR family [Caldimonas brevitalea]
MSDTPIRLLCHCGTLRQAVRAITKVYDAKLSRHGIKITQFTILSVVKERGRVTTGELAKGLLMDSTTLSRTLATLKRAGLVDCEVGAEDLRERYWRVTRLGSSTLNKSQKDWQDAQEELRMAAGMQNVRDIDARAYDVASRLASLS